MKIDLKNHDLSSSITQCLIFGTKYHAQVGCLHLSNNGKEFHSCVGASQPLPSKHLGGTGKFRTVYRHSSAAPTSSFLNQACAGSLAVRRCQAIDTVAEKSIGSGTMAISPVAAICVAVRLGTVAIRAAARA